MTTMERSLAQLVAAGTVTALEAEKWADDRNVFLDEMKRLTAHAPVKSKPADDGE